MTIFGNLGDDDMEYGEEFFEEETVDTTIYVTGQITSFNTEIIDTTLWTKIDKVLPQNETMVINGQEILNVSNDAATGIVYATIDGEFIVDDENTNKKTYMIYDLNNLGFEAEVDEDKAKLLEIGQKVDVTIKASNEKTDGRICYISHIPQNDMIKVRVKLNNNDRIKIGYSVKAEILVDETSDKNTLVYDIKNSIPKIGKTVVTYKNVPEVTEFSSPEEVFQDDGLMGMIEYYDLEIPDYYYEEPEEPVEEEPGEGGAEEDHPETEPKEEDKDKDKDKDIDLEEISEYFNSFWSEYWSEYWHAFYIEIYGYEVGPY